MSGGVDSSVAAALLAEQGHDVIGVSMQLYDQSQTDASGARAFGTCCTIDDLYDARRVAATIGIPHYIVNFESQFGDHVVSNFVNEYIAGRTPDSVLALQQRPQVCRVARSREGLRRRDAGDRPLRARRGGRRRPVSPLPRRRQSARTRPTSCSH